MLSRIVRPPSSFSAFAFTRPQSRSYYRFGPGELGKAWAKSEIAALVSFPFSFAVVFFWAYKTMWSSVSFNYRSDLFEAENPWSDANHITKLRQLQVESRDENFQGKHAPGAATYIAERDSIDEAIRGVETLRKDNGDWQ